MVHQELLTSSSPSPARSLSRGFTHFFQELYKVFMVVFYKDMKGQNFCNLYFRHIRFVTTLDSDQRSELIL